MTALMCAYEKRVNSAVSSMVSHLVVIGGADGVLIGFLATVGPRWAVRQVSDRPSITRRPRTTLSANRDLRCSGVTDGIGGLNPARPVGLQIGLLPGGRRAESPYFVLSGRQDSNLRPLVPQTSTYCALRAEFDLECFRRETVGMTTSVRVLESVGMA